ncbi:MAG: DUF4258 domain-containing protein [Ignavibacteriae bacterium]|nr:DUF4258 domain-containing protein [Ignavibacteriota bacterium]
MNIDFIRDSIVSEFYLTQHAMQKMLERAISKNEVSEVINNGVIIEEYPNDKYGPSCLIFGTTKEERPLHVLVSYSNPVWVVTTYVPSEEEWIENQYRKVR